MVRRRLDQHQQADAGGERNEVQHVDLDPVVLVHLRHQVRGGDVEEIPRGEGHDEGDVDLHRSRVGEEASHEKRERRSHAHQQCPALAPPAVEQHAVLAELLGELVGGRREPDAHAQSDIDEERRRAIRDYYGRPFGNEQEGRSRVVLTDVSKLNLLQETLADTETEVLGGAEHLVIAGRGAIAVAIIKEYCFIGLLQGVVFPLVASGEFGGKRLIRALVNVIQSPVQAV